MKVAIRGDERYPEWRVEPIVTEEDNQLAHDMSFTILDITESEIERFNALAAQFESAQKELQALYRRGRITG